MSEEHKQMIRSILASVIGIAGSLLLIAGAVEAADVVELPSWWVQGVAIVTAVATVARTALAWLDPKNTSFGRGSQQ
jgi:Na+-translocating ferredoxin:NAD+ oxidoreductase RnfA subunit